MNGAPRTPRIVVVGGGMAGLAAAHRLVSDGRDVTLLEAAATPGGWIGSERVDGFVLEKGPLAWRGPGTEGRALLEELKLEDAVLYASPAAANRYVVIERRLIAVPANPLAFARSSLLSTAGKVRLFREPFVKTPPPGDDESIANFTRRRFGAETGRLVDPIVSGIFAGDAERLSVRSAFPALARWEHDGGSVFRGAMRAMKSRQRKGTPRSKARLLSFREGLATLVSRTSAALGSSLRAGSRVTAIEPVANGSWMVRVEGADGVFEADRVVLALPAHAAAPLLAPLDPEAARLLDDIEFAGVIVACFDYPEEAFATPPRGFGFLVPRSEGLRMLGCLFVSSLFPDHAPRGRVSLRVLAGGVHDPGAIDEREETLVRTLRDELSRLLGARAEPRLLRLHRHRRAIPQYTLGYERRLAALADRLRALPGIHLAGSSYAGISIPDCIVEGRRVAREISPS